MYETMPTVPEEMHEVLEALYRAMGKPETVPVTVEDDDGVIFADDNALHPVFPLARHYYGKDGYADRGYTGNPCRGDHMTVPVYSENGDVYALDIAFHKGRMCEICMRYPHAPAEVKEIVYRFLTRMETR